MKSKTLLVREVLGDNRKGNEANLIKYKPQWNTKDTKTIRVPTALADKVLEYAHKLDDSEVIDNAINPLVTETLRALANKIKHQEKGYKSNSATALIKEIKALVKML